METTTRNSEDAPPMEVMPPSAIMAMERAMIDTQVATAHQYPRSLEIFKKRALSMATLDEESAESCIYLRPVGKEKNAKGQWVEKYAEGPSIRLAEIVGASYGNLRVASRIVEQTDRFVRCEGVAHDLESNFAAKSEVVESTVTRDGVPYSERQRALTAKVCLAKALRDATFRVVPRALCKPVFDAAKGVAQGKNKPLEERRKKAQAWIGTLKIDESRVLAAMGVNGWSEMNDDHLLKLTGLRTAIGDGDVTIDEAFPPVAKTPEPTPLQKSALKPAKTAPVASESDRKQSEAVQTPAEPEKPVLGQTDGGNSGSGESFEASTAPSGEPAADKPPFTPDPNELPQLQALHAKMWESDVTNEQMLAWTLTAKLRRDNQKTLAELSAKKLTDICEAWERILPKIKG